MSGDFLDSNVFLYSLDAASPAKQDIASGLIEAAVRHGNSSISFQVVQEVLNAVVRRVDPPMAIGDIERFLDRFLMPLWDVMPTRALYNHAMAVLQRYRYSFYDSLIIAAALEAGCSRLFTEDLQHGQRIESMRIENPFLTA